MSLVSQPHQHSSASQGIVSPTSPTNFLDLPRELRDKIYALAVTSPEAIKLIADHSKQACSSHNYLYVTKPWPELELDVSILRVSKQIYSEATSILYGSNMFVIGKDHSEYHQPNGPHPPFCTDQSKNCRHVRHLLHISTHVALVKRSYINRDTQTVFINLNPRQMAEYLLPMVRDSTTRFATLGNKSTDCVPAADGIFDMVDWYTRLSSTTKWHPRVAEFQSELQAELRKLLDQ